MIDLTEKEIKIIIREMENRFENLTAEFPALARNPFLNSDLLPFYKKQINITVKIIQKLKAYDTQNFPENQRPDPVKRLQPISRQPRNAIYSRSFRKKDNSHAKAG